MADDHAGRWCVLLVGVVCLGGSMGEGTPLRGGGASAADAAMSMDARALSAGV